MMLWLYKLLILFKSFEIVITNRLEQLTEVQIAADC